tara:strand:+ start:117 stop:671 length:555 start_codon:yes stop_codon:yes gene_type:complete
MIADYTKVVTESKDFEDMKNEVNNSPYYGSTFEYFWMASSGKKGVYGERFLDIISDDMNIPCYSGKEVKKHELVQFDRISDFDRVIEVGGVYYKVEVKTSTEWENNGGFKFQQIRPNHDYDILVCHFVYPEIIKSFFAWKDSIDFSQMKGQHGGNAAEETKWFTVDSEDYLEDIFTPYSDIVSI